MAGTDTPTPATQPEPSTAPEPLTTPGVTASPGSATSPEASATERVAPVAEVGPGRRVLQQIAENPLQSLFGAAIIALLTFTLTTTHARFGDVNRRIDDQNADINARFDDVNRRIDDQNADINARFDDVNRRIDDQNVAFNERFDDVNARIDETNERITRLEESVAEVNLKLTALIAALNMSAQVDAAQEGRIIDTEQASEAE